MQMYAKSKIMAEKAAWDYREALPEAERFDIVTILPSFVLGPNLRADWFASGDWLRRLMTGEMTEIACDGCAIVDVRDVALAHFNAIKLDAAANKRFIVSHSSQPWAECARPVIAKYQPLGWPICTTHAAVDPEKKTTMFNNAASREVLGIEYRDFPTTMIEMADAMVALGTIKKPEAQAQ